MRHHRPGADLSEVPITNELLAPDLNRRRRSECTSVVYHQLRPTVQPTVVLQDAH